MPKSKRTIGDAPKIPKSCRGRNRKKPSPKKDLMPTPNCLGVILQERERSILNPYGFSCSTRCRHPIFLPTNKGLDADLCRKKCDDLDWISEDIYRKYTDTDSRPISPRRSSSLPRPPSLSASATEMRKLHSPEPEPESRQCQFHQRRVLILDLRRVKSVDAITRQNSITTSVDSNYDDNDDDEFGTENKSSSAYPESSTAYQQFSTPRNLSKSRSTTPKSRIINRKKRKSKERSVSPTYERSTSPKILEGLTLPPLHSSVLTLLGQSSPLKNSPRNLQSNTNTESNVGNRQKLRRHGRKSKKEKQDEITDGESGPSKEPRKKGRNDDDPNDTQIAIFQEEVDADEIEHSEDNSQSKGCANKEIHFPRKSLHELLDEKLLTSEWNPKNFQTIEKEIEMLDAKFKGYETKFKPSNLKMNEEIWLNIPKTCVRSSAIFSVPSDSRLLKTLTPNEYLKDYVQISDPRKHLYSLVFHRYRTKENPMKKTISFQYLEKSLIEIIGKQLTEKEIADLRFALLEDNQQDIQIDEEMYRGICAYTERVFGRYSLEDSNDCFYCITNLTKDKTRCHKGQRNQLEKADFEFLQNKIKKGQIPAKLSHLLQTIYDHNHNS